MNSVELLNKTKTRRDELMDQIIEGMIDDWNECIDKQYRPKMKNYKRQRCIAYVGYFIAACLFPVAIAGLISNINCPFYYSIMFLALIVYSASALYDSHCKTFESLYKNAIIRCLQEISDLEDRRKNI